MLDFRMKVVIGCLLVLILSIAMFIFLRPHSYGPPPFPIETAERLSVDELVAMARTVEPNKLNADGRFDSGILLLPTWMPGKIKLQEIFLPSTVVVMVYGDDPIQQDILEGKACVELRMTNHSPTLEELRNQTSSEVLEVGDLLVVVDDDAHPGRGWEERGIEPMLAYFYHDGFYYLITVRKGDFTRDDLVRIVENMKPVGQETLRKLERVPN